MVEGRSRLSTPGKATRTQSMRQTQSPSTNLKNTSPYQRKNLAENNSRTLSTAMSSASKVAALVTGRSNSATKENNNNARQSYAGARGKSGTGNAIDGKRKAVFCDVVLDGLPYDAEGNVISPEGKFPHYVLIYAIAMALEFTPRSTTAYLLNGAMD